MRSEFSTLVVDDDIVDQRSMVRALRSVGVADISTFTRCEDALAHLHERDPSATIILLDHNLPEMSGLEMLRELRASPETRGIPVVMLTSVDRDDLKTECYELGAAGFFIKPESSDAYHATAASFVRYWESCELP